MDSLNEHEITRNIFTSCKKKQNTHTKIIGKRHFVICQKSSFFLYTKALKSINIYHERCSRASKKFLLLISRKKKHEKEEIFWKFKKKQTRRPKSESWIIKRDIWNVFTDWRAYCGSISQRKIQLTRTQFKSLICDKNFKIRKNFDVIKFYSF